MSGKRFINDIDNGQLIDTKGELSTIDYSDSVDFYGLWEFLNKLNDENEQLKQHQRTLEAKIVRLKDRVKTFEKNYSLKDIERYKKMENYNCITSKRLGE